MPQYRNQARQFFSEKYGLSDTDLDRYLSAALADGGDYADLYFEYRSTSSISLDESLVKGATQGVSVGCGIRVISGERTGYAYTDDLSSDKIVKAARLAAHISSAPARVVSMNINEQSQQALARNLYPVVQAPTDMDLATKLDLVWRADRAARAHDSRIAQVRAGYADEVRTILNVTSEGGITGDYQPLARFSVFCLAQDGSQVQRGSSGGGGRVEFDFFLNEKTPEHFATEAARQAILQLDAVDAPAGEMEVVLGPGWPGILLHEAIGHGLESDFNRKKTSAFSGMIGQRVASDICTVVDDGTLPSRRGSLNVDDEGTPTSTTVLIEKGILRGYLQDRLSAQLTGATLTGNGRRESYAHIPMPRMTNTYMLSGESDPADILRSVKRGLYAVQFGGGQVDITNGKFVFTASEAYLIEDGKVTRPVRNATLIGDGPTVLRQVSMVGHDLQLDEGIGTCGKDGQSVPVGVGIPTIKVDRLTVGGTG
ncbi:MAG: metalloprotease TldD [Acidobacteria bacterium]|nr:metalloprotease TldD [Acidobacteriota bacterium]